MVLLSVCSFNEHEDAYDCIYKCHGTGVRPRWRFKSRFVTPCQWHVMLYQKVYESVESKDSKKISMYKMQRWQDHNSWGRFCSSTRVTSKEMPRNQQKKTSPYGCFRKWWYPQNTPKWSFLVGKPMVVGYHHFRKPPYMAFQPLSWSSST